MPLARWVLVLRRTLMYLDIRRTANRPLGKDAVDNLQIRRLCMALHRRPKDGTFLTGVAPIEIRSPFPTWRSNLIHKDKLLQVNR